MRPLVTPLHKSLAADTLSMNPHTHQLQMKLYFIWTQHGFVSTRQRTVDLVFEVLEFVCSDVAILNDSQTLITLELSCVQVLGDHFVWRDGLVRLLACGTLIFVGDGRFDTLLTVGHRALIATLRLPENEVTKDTPEVGVERQIALVVAWFELNFYLVDFEVGRDFFHGVVD